MFPSLQILDLVEFEQEIGFGLPSTPGKLQDLPISVKASFMDSIVTADMLQDFIPKYVHFFLSNPFFVWFLKICYIILGSLNCLIRIGAVLSTCMRTVPNSLFQ
jgi:hypothetical protein